MWQARAWLAIVDDNSCIADHALPRETVIVGDERGYFLYRSGNETRNVCGSKKYLSVAIGLIFARDRDKSNGIYFCVYLCGTLCFLMCPIWINMHTFSV